MKNLDLREVNNDILRDLLEAREERFYDEDNINDVTHVVYFDEVAEKILKNVPAKNKNMLKSNLIFLIRILWIIFLIGMRSIIEMGFVMEWR